MRLRCNFYCLTIKLCLPLIPPLFFSSFCFGPVTYLKARLKIYIIQIFIYYIYTISCKEIKKGHLRFRVPLFKLYCIYLYC